MKRLLLLLCCLGLAACGGSSSPVDRAAVGGATLATSAPGGKGVGAGKRSTGDFAVGEPSLDQLSELPPAEYGSTAASCAGTGVEPTAANRASINSATLCLLNVERVSRRLPRLRANQRLARASLAHSADMVTRTYFSHDSPDGKTFVDRIKRSGYLYGARGWTVGENLAWGSGARATPAEIVRAWMASPGHKANILNGRFREIGIGVALGVPVARGSSGATYGTDFGARS